MATGEAMRNLDQGFAIYRLLWYNTAVAANTRPVHADNKEKHR